MATEQECIDALDRLAGRIAASEHRTSYTRTLSCVVRDLDVILGARLVDGALTGIGKVESPDAQIRLIMTSDDLTRLVDGELNLATAWASGRISVHAGVRDLLRLRALV